MRADTDPCPCGSKKTFGECCGPYLSQGKVAEDPTTLMRSRYTAFCLSDVEYLTQTWHPETCPDDLAADEPSNWVSLEILGAEVDGDEAEVEFRACLIFDNKLETLHEISSFDRLDGKWLYHSGEFQNEGAKPKTIARNAPCPCASGKLFSQCHLTRGGS
jgi:SEC-C motif-containing protein